MKNKKSFLLYCDVIHTIKHLSDEKAGKLFKHILSYVNDENPVSDDIILNIAFEPIKQQLKRDLQVYNNIVERNKTNGAKGGRPKKETQKTQKNPKEPKKPDNDNDNDNDIDIIYNLYPSVCPYGKRSTSKNSKDKTKIAKLLKEKTFEEISSSIKGYLSVMELSNEGKDFKVNLKNFRTFLNNLPSSDELRSEWALLKKDKVIYDDKGKVKINFGSQTTKN